MSTQDRIETEEASGQEVVDAVLDKMESSGWISEIIKQFLRRIAIVESIFGTHSNTFRSGYHGGIWQVDEIGFNDTQNTSSHPNLTRKYEKISQILGVDWSSTKWSDLRKPLYSAIAARLLLSNIREAIPSTLEGQARYWKQYYNSESGKGTESKFIERVKAAEGSPDQTKAEEASGQEVVDAVLDKMESSGWISEIIKQFLRRIAIVESIFGTHSNTFRSGYHGGIWQVDEIGFNDTQNTSSHPNLTRKYEKISQTLGVDWSSTKWSDLRKPLYSAIAARLLLSNIREAIPSTLEGQARYWKQYYNSESGKGTESKFIERVKAAEA